MTQRLIDTIWGSTGAVTDPGATIMNKGWIAEIPTHQVQNFWQKRVDEQLQYQQQSGVEAWSALVIYLDNAIVVGSDGAIYQSQQATNANHDPVGDSGTWWKIYGLLTLMPQGYISGLTMANNATDPAQDIDIAPGVCRNAADTAGMSLAASMTKRFDAFWAAGSTQGGRASTITTVANNTWYRVFAIALADGTIDVGFDDSATAANLLADAGASYVSYRRIGWIRTSGTGTIVAFRQSAATPGYVEWQQPILNHAEGAWGTGLVTRNASAPPLGIAVLDHHSRHAGAGANVSECFFKLFPTSQTDIGVGSGNYSLMAWNQDTDFANAGQQIDVEVDLLSQYRWRASSGLGSSNLRITTLGYRYNRGA